MAKQVFPTKSNLINTKKTLELARLGYDLMDKKRNILVREMMSLIDKIGDIQTEISSTFSEAYSALQIANVTLGKCDEFAATVPIENGIKIDYRSVMGVELPMVEFSSSVANNAYYGFRLTNSKLDEAYIKFDKVKRLTVKFAELESSIYRLADAIKKTQKRANALNNIMIPQFQSTVKFITEALEEKEREDFSRLKVIKRQKGE